eukprot:1491570-Amphidinium_carterae.2
MAPCTMYSAISSVRPLRGLPKVVDSHNSFLGYSFRAVTELPQRATYSSTISMGCGFQARCSRIQRWRFVTAETLRFTSTINLGHSQMRDHWLA